MDNMERVREAAKRMASRFHGCEPVDEFDEFVIVKEPDNDDVLVFIYCDYDTRGFYLEHKEFVMMKFEQAASRWLMDHDDKAHEYSVRCDYFFMVILSEDRAFVRYIIDYLNYGENDEEETI